MTAYRDSAEHHLTIAAIHTPHGQPIDYAQLCKDAATRQGLDPLAWMLDAAGVVYEIEQTGGFCMVLTVRTPTGVMAAIHDPSSDTDPRPWLSGFYPGDTWDESGESEADENHDLADTVTRLAEFARKR